ncbi:MAG: L-lactate permease [Candidatus Bathyarchaeia archaeon]|nr:L-lactate permease [Candidatus Bathyarchaeota archaeon A05DMB-4]MDH7595369.1 L-lactate permease [Candidatus Bathyarchaeota archaeon]
MKEKIITILSLITLAIFGIVALVLAQFGQGSWKFLLAFYPLLVILVGVAFLRQSGLTMAFIGLIFTILLAIFQFGTSLEVALGASIYGFVKSFGISVSVAATMLMIFLMREAGALGTISKVIKQQVIGREIQALYIGIGFGSFLTSLGVVTPALFPPFLVAMGFAPTSAIAIAVLGYDPTTSFSLLSIPITLPAQVGGLDPIEFAFKIAIFLPLVSTGFAFAILWVIGGKSSMRKAAVPAVACGLALALACLGAVSLDYFTGVEYVPLRIVGVIAGLAAMGALYVYQKLEPRTEKPQKNNDYPKIKEILRAFSPWIILVALAATVSVPQVDAVLKNALGNLERITIFADQVVDLDILSQIYTWIFAAIFLSLLVLRPKRKQVKDSLSFWLRRFMGPFLAYSIYFSIAFVMAWSAMEVVNGHLTRTSLYDLQNMNVILGTTLAKIFGAGYIFVATSLGLFGAIVGGSETSSNVLFLNIQKTASDNIGLGHSEFMTLYGSHAVAGGIASAVTPAKINNAVVTIDETKHTESFIMRKHLIVALLLTVATGILTGFFVSIGI